MEKLDINEPYDLDSDRTKWLLGRFAETIDSRLDNAMARLVKTNEILDSDVSQSVNPQALADFKEHLADQARERAMGEATGFRELAKDLMNGMPVGTVVSELDNTRRLGEDAKFVAGLGPGLDAGQSFAMDYIGRNRVGIEERNRYFNINTMVPMISKSGAQIYSLTFDKNLIDNANEFDALETDSKFKPVYVNGNLGDTIIKNTMLSYAHSEVMDFGHNSFTDKDADAYLEYIHTNVSPLKDDALGSIALMVDAYQKASDVRYVDSFAEWMPTSDAVNDITWSAQHDDYADMDYRLSGLRGQFVDLNGETAIDLDTVDFTKPVKLGDLEEINAHFSVDQTYEYIATGQDMISNFTPDNSKHFEKPKPVVGTQLNLLKDLDDSVLQSWGDDLLEM